MNVEEIFRIIEEDFEMCINAYAEGDWTLPEDFVHSDELAIRVTRSKTARDNYNNHPGCRDYAKRDKEYDRLKEVYYSDTYPYDECISEVLEHYGIGPIEKVSSHGGEGQGDHWEVVNYFSKHDIYIRTVGTYSSYNGTDFYNGYGNQVVPKQKTITVYE